jgi:lipopolysaccharide/colanic/teichoic acid biosynthesis glycosyltransferase
VWKRAIDLILSALGLFLLLPVLVVVAVWIKLDSKGPVLFRQERIGQGLRKFVIFKFRTMVEDAPHKGGQLTTSEDPRITRAGRILRDTKIDELPQLINVLRGEMSLVGPRPEVSRYVDLFPSEYEEILQMPPGITDLASLKYRNESAALQFAPDAEREYITRLLPDKIALAKEYVRRSSFSLDIALLLKTFWRVFVR